MFLHNKFLSFLIACTVANPCFAGGILSNVNKSGINTKPINTDSIVFPSSFNICYCPKNYYVSKCGDMDLDLGTINALVRVKYGIDGNTCWNDSYTDMHYLLHLNNNSEPDYKNSTLNPQPTGIYFYNTGASWSICSDDIKSTLTKLRTEVYSACVNSCICTKCPNDGVTDSKTNLTTPDSTTFFENFNTIADCYTYGGSDGKGTFTVKGNTDDENHRCYYSE